MEASFQVYGSSLEVVDRVLRLAARIIVKHGAVTIQRGAYDPAV